MDGGKTEPGPTVLFDDAAAAARAPGVVRRVVRQKEIEEDGAEASSTEIDASLAEAAPEQAAPAEDIQETVDETASLAGTALDEPDPVEEGPSVEGQGLEEVRAVEAEPIDGSGWIDPEYFTPKEISGLVISSSLQIYLARCQKRDDASMQVAVDDAARVLTYSIDGMLIAGSFEKATTATGASADVLQNSRARILADVAAREAAEAGG